MSEQPKNYVQVKQDFIENTKKEFEGVLRHPGLYVLRACNLIFRTLEEDHPDSRTQIRDLLLHNQTYQANLKQLIRELASTDSHGFFNVSEKIDIDNRQARDRFRLDQRYKDFVMASFQIQPQPEMQVAAQCATPNFNWTKLALFAAPPVGIGFTYVGAAKDVKAVNDFFAANIQVIAAISATYYALLLVACAVQYCRNHVRIENEDSDMEDSHHSNDSRHSSE